MISEHDQILKTINVMNALDPNIEWKPVSLKRTVDWLSFKESRKIARSLNIKNMREWNAYCKSGKRPYNIPLCPRDVYMNKGWISWADFLGTSNFKNVDWLSYEEAKIYVRSLGFKNGNEYKIWAKTNKRPQNMPSGPSRTYMNKGWISWADFLGTSNFKNVDWLSYEEAKIYVRSLNIKNMREWNEYCKSVKKPHNIPANLKQSYSDSGWISWPDFLGTERIRNIDWLSYEEAKMFVISLGFKNEGEYKYWSKTNKRQKNIPATPERIYKDKGWASWGDYLGTGFVANQNKIFLPYEEAEKFVASLGLKNIKEWIDYKRSGKRPQNIPATPEKIYKDKGWKSWRYFLGTNFLPYEDAKAFAKSLGLNSLEEFNKYCKSNKKPKNIPTNPNVVYIDKGWINWSDFLGTNRVKDVQWISYEEAKMFVKTFQLIGIKDWKIYCSSGKRPYNIPAHPREIYKDKGWISWLDFLGTID